VDLRRNFKTARWKYTF